jgi:hypothetical protein
LDLNQGFKPIRLAEPTGLEPAMRRPASFYPPFLSTLQNTAACRLANQFVKEQQKTTDDLNALAIVGSGLRCIIGSRAVQNLGANLLMTETKGSQ